MNIDGYMRNKFKETISFDDEMERIGDIIIDPIEIIPMRDLIDYRDVIWFTYECEDNKILTHINTKILKARAGKFDELFIKLLNIFLEKIEYTEILKDIVTGQSR